MICFGKIPCSLSSAEQTLTAKPQQEGKYVIRHAARPETRTAKETHMVSYIADDIADDTADTT